MPPLIAGLVGIPPHIVPYYMPVPVFAVPFLHLLGAIIPAPTFVNATRTPTHPALTEVVFPIVWPILFWKLHSALITPQPTQLPYTRLGEGVRSLANRPKKETAEGVSILPYNQPRLLPQKSKRVWPASTMNTANTVYICNMDIFAANAQRVKNKKERVKKECKHQETLPNRMQNRDKRTREALITIRPESLSIIC